MEWITYSDYGSVTFGSIIRVNEACYITLHDGYIRLPLNGSYGFRKADNDEAHVIRSATPIEVLLLAEESESGDKYTSLLHMVSEFINDKL